MNKTLEGKKALFIHISKTGGSSIGKAPFIILQGSPAQDPRWAVKDNGLKFSFSFVRNPYERFTSAVFNHGYTTPDKFEEWMKNTFWEEFQNRFKKWEWQELIPQTQYLYHNGECHVDFVGRFENLESDWEKVLERADEKFPLPHLNKNKFPDHAKYHTEVTRVMLRKVYITDFMALNYDF